LAEAVQKLGLIYVVITSVTRDDLPDGGASHYAKIIQNIRKLNPGTLIEVLIPDLEGNKESIDIVIDARPDVLNHNLETVKKLYPAVRPEAIYKRSLAVLRYVKKKAPCIYTKTGIMVGLGESDEEVYQVMDDIMEVGCDILTIGQYLRPSVAHIEMKENISLEKFEHYKKIGEEKGILYVASGPLVRSSYKAEEAYKAGVSKYDLRRK